MPAEENILQIPLGTVCSMEYMDEFINKLSKKQGEEMYIHQTSKEFSIHCSNEPIDICPFHFLFTKKIDFESKEIGLQLKNKHIEHSEMCKVHNEDVSFERNRLMIIDSKKLIVNIILERYCQYGPQNPKKILELVSQALGYNGIFINKGIRSLELKRRLKKKFDNMVAEIRKEYDLTPTMLAKGRKVKKPRAKFRLFQQKSSQSCENSQENMIQMEEEDDMNEYDDDDQSDFYPSQSLKRLNDDNRQRQKIQQKQKEMVQQQVSHSCRSTTESSLVSELRKTKEKAIRKSC